MSENTLVKFWDSFIEEISDVTNNLGNAIASNNSTSIIQEYNKIPTILNEKKITDFLNLIEKIKEEKKIDSEINKRFKQLEEIVNNIDPTTNFCSYIYDLFDNKDVVERLSKELLHERSKNNQISHLQIQINTNKIKLKGVLNKDTKESLQKQIKRDEEQLEKLTNVEDSTITNLNNEIKQLKSKLESMEESNKSVNEYLEKIEFLESSLKNKDIEINRLNESLLSSNTELSALKDKNTTVSNVGNFDIDTYKMSILNKLSTNNPSDTIKNIHNLLLSKKTSDAKRMCVKALSNNNFNSDLSKEIDEMVKTIKGQCVINI